jgi:tetratricopeptide (TPR) repeat protein
LEGTINVAGSLIAPYQTPLKFGSLAQVHDHTFVLLLPQRNSMDVSMILAARCLQGGILLGATIAVCAYGTPARATTDQLSEQILAAQKAEADRHFGKAIDLYNEAMGRRRSVEDLRVLLKKRAAVFEMVRQTTKAEADFTAALKVEPVDPTLYADRGYFYLRQQRFDSALADFATGSRLDPANPLFRFATGRVHAVMADYPGAIEWYNDALRLNRAYAIAILFRAEAYVHLERFREAKADYDAAVQFPFKRDDDRFFAFLGRGYVNMVLEDLDGAIADLDQALEVRPGDLHALLYRGYANERRGALNLALHDYERAFSLSPDNIWVRASLQRLRSN